MKILKRGDSLKPEFNDICPQCGHEGCVWSAMEVDEDSAWQEGRCPSCELEWEEIYLASHRKITSGAKRMANGQIRRRSNDDNAT